MKFTRKGLAGGLLFGTIWAHNTGYAEGQIMERFIQLNLRDEKENVNAASLPKPEGKEPENQVIGKRVNKLVNKAAHKAASHYGRGGSGIFSK